MWRKWSCTRYFKFRLQHLWSLFSSSFTYMQWNLGWFRFRVDRTLLYVRWWYIYKPSWWCNASIVHNFPGCWAYHLVIRFTLYTRSLRLIVCLPTLQSQHCRLLGCKDTCSRWSNISCWYLDQFVPSWTRSKFDHSSSSSKLGRNYRNHHYSSIAGHCFYGLKWNLSVPSYLRGVHLSVHWGRNRFNV